MTKLREAVRERWEEIREMMSVSIITLETPHSADDVPIRTWG